MGRLLQPSVHVLIGTSRSAQPNFPHPMPASMVWVQRQTSALPSDPTIVKSAHERSSAARPPIPKRALAHPPKHPASSACSTSTEKLIFIHARKKFSCLVHCVRIPYNGIARPLLYVACLCASRCRWYVPAVPPCRLFRQPRAVPLPRPHPPGPTSVFIHIHRAASTAAFIHSTSGLQCIQRREEERREKRAGAASAALP